MSTVNKKRLEDHAIKAKSEMTRFIFRALLWCLDDEPMTCHSESDCHPTTEKCEECPKDKCVCWCHTGPLEDCGCECPKPRVLQPLIEADAQGCDERMPHDFYGESLEPCIHEQENWKPCTKGCNKPSPEPTCDCLKMGCTTCVGEGCDHASAEERMSEAASTVGYNLGLTKAAEIAREHKFQLYRTENNGVIEAGEAIATAIEAERGKETE